MSILAHIWTFPLKYLWLLIGNFPGDSKAYVIPMCIVWLSDESKAPDAGNELQGVEMTE